MIYNLKPVPKPRMTRADKWKRRKCVIEYRAFCDKVRELGIKVDSDTKVIFYIPMPKSWSNKKKAEYDRKPHQSKPDIDNLVKAILDALYEDDSHIYKLHAEKYWDYIGKIETITLIREQENE